MCVVADHPNEWEQKARARKALALADVFTTLHSTPEQLEALPEEGWRMAAQLAKVNVPSATTRELVVDVLRHRLEVHSDPFVGLPA